MPLTPRKVDQRPATAPAALKSTVSSSPLEVTTGKTVSPADSMKTIDTGYSSASSAFSDNITFREDLHSRSSMHSEPSPRSPIEAWKSVEKLDFDDSLARNCPSIQQFRNFESPRQRVHIESPRLKLGSQSPRQDSSIVSPRIKSPRKMEKSIAKQKHKEKDSVVIDEHVPIPVMEHSKPKTINVGAIGRISLLESISEAQYWEEKCQSRMETESIASESTDSGVSENVDDNYLCETPRCADEHRGQTDELDVDFNSKPIDTFKKQASQYNDNPDSFDIHAGDNRRYPSAVQRLIKDRKSKSKKLKRPTNPQQLRTGNDNQTISNTTHKKSVRVTSAGSRFTNTTSTKIQYSAEENSSSDLEKVGKRVAVMEPKSDTSKESSATASSKHKMRRLLHRFDGEIAPKHFKSCLSKA